MFTKLLRESFSTHAKLPVIVVGSRTYSYNELAEIISGICRLIKQNCNDHNPRIAIVTNNDAETYASVFAVWLCGGSFLPVNPAYPVEHNKRIIDLCEVKLVLNSKASGIFNNEFNTTNVCEKVISLPVITPDKNDLMYILFTSGSTGEPKGVPITYGNAEAYIISFHSNGYDFTSEDRFLQPFELSFDASLDCYLIPALHGACIFPIDTEGIRYLNAIKLMQNNKLTVAKLTPSMVAFLRPYFGKINLAEMRYCLFGGEGLPESLVTEWAKCIPNARIHNLYGPTEATVECFFYDASPDAEPSSHKGFISIGKPTGDTLAIICNNKNEILPNNSEGELCISGPQVTSGYINNPALNEAAFFTAKENGKEHRFYKTGDIAFRSDNGNYFCLGRNDRQVKIQGYRVELDEIEICANRFSGKNKFASIFKDNKVLLFSDFDNNYKLMDWLTKKLPPWMVPAEIISIKEIPLNINGKTDYKKLMKYGR